MSKKIKISHQNILLSLGFTKIELEIYFLVLQKGTLSVSEIAKEKNINRTQVYEVLPNLIKQGLIEKTKQKRGKLIAANPEIMSQIADKKIIEAEQKSALISSILPDLKQLKKELPSSAVITHYEGLSQLKNAYQRELREAKQTEVLSFVGSLEDTFLFFSEKYWDNWNAKFVKNGSCSRMLVQESFLVRKTTTEDKRYRRSTRYIDQFDLKLNIDIFDNSVLIVSFYDQLAMWIESPFIANSYKILFERLWLVAKK